MLKLLEDHYPLPQPPPEQNGSAAGQIDGKRSCEGADRPAPKRRRGAAKDKEAQETPERATGSPILKEETPWDDGDKVGVCGPPRRPYTEDCVWMCMCAYAYLNLHASAWNTCVWRHDGQAF